MAGWIGLCLVLLSCIVCATFDHRAWLGPTTERCLLFVAALSRLSNQQM